MTLTKEQIASLREYVRADDALQKELAGNKKALLCSIRDAQYQAVGSLQKLFSKDEVQYLTSINTARITAMLDKLEGK